MPTTAALRLNSPTFSRANTPQSTNPATDAAALGLTKAGSQESLRSPAPATATATRGQLTTRAPPTTPPPTNNTSSRTSSSQRAQLFAPQTASEPRHYFGPWTLHVFISTPAHSHAPARSCIEHHCAPRLVRAGRTRGLPPPTALLILISLVTSIYIHRSLSMSRSPHYIRIFHVTGH